MRGCVCVCVWTDSDKSSSFSGVTPSHHPPGLHGKLVHSLAKIGGNIQVIRMVFVCVLTLN